MGLGSLGEYIVQAADVLDKLGWRDRFRDRFWPFPRVVVLGSSGTGKSQTLRSLVNPIAEPIDRFHRTTVSQEFTLRLGDSAFFLVDTPGDAPHTLERERGLRLALAGSRGNPIGLIHIVSFGYHENSTNEDNYFGPAGLIERKLEEMRVQEIALLKELEHNRSFPIAWNVVILNKADLWWERRDDVFRHYSAGQFNDVLRAATRAEAAYMFYCCITKAFYELHPGPVCFNDRQRTGLRKSLLEALLQRVEGTPRKLQE